MAFKCWTAIDLQRVLGTGGLSALCSLSRVVTYVVSVKLRPSSNTKSNNFRTPRKKAGLQRHRTSIDTAIGVHGILCHWRTRPRFAPGTLLHRCSDLGQVVNLSLSVA